MMQEQNRLISHLPIPQQIIDSEKKLYIGGREVEVVLVVVESISVVGHGKQKWCSWEEEAVEMLSLRLGGSSTIPEGKDRPQSAKPS